MCQGDIFKTIVILNKNYIYMYMYIYLMTNMDGNESIFPLL